MPKLRFKMSGSSSADEQVRKSEKVPEPGDDVVFTGGEKYTVYSVDRVFEMGAATTKQTDVVYDVHCRQNGGLTKQ